MRSWDLMQEQMCQLAAGPCPGYEEAAKSLKGGIMPFLEDLMYLFGTLGVHLKERASRYHTR
jgi:hypothetical protein